MIKRYGGKKMRGFINIFQTLLNKSYILDVNDLYFKILNYKKFLLLNKNTFLEINIKGNLVSLRSWGLTQ